MGIVAEIKRLQAEIERRGKHIDELSSALAGMAQALVSSFNEIARLQAALSDQQRHDDGERPHD